MNTKKPKELLGLEHFKRLSPMDRIGAAAVVVGIGMVALGWLIEELGGVVGAVSPLRIMGGILLFGGIAVLLLYDPHRRAMVIGKIRWLVNWYQAKTASWNWPDRVGLAGVIIGLILVLPCIVLQIIFRTSFGMIILAVLSFWGGVGLLIYGRFYRRGSGENRPRRPTSSSPRRNRQKKNNMGR